MRVKKSLKNIEAIKKIGIFCWSIVGLIIIIAFFLYFIYLIRIAIIPLIIAVAIAYLLIPLIFLLQKRMRKIFAIIITYIIFLSLIFNIFFFLIPLIIDQSKVFINSFPIYLQNLTNISNNFLQNSIIIKDVENLIGKELIPKDAHTITQYFIDRINLEDIDISLGVTIFTKSIINVVLNLIVGPLLGLYILKDVDKIRTTFMKVIPKRFKPQVIKTIDMINNVAGRYIRGQILISIIVGTLCTIVLLTLRVDFAFLLGFIAGLFNLVPFLGPIIGVIPAALVALFLSPLKALLVILLFIAIQQIYNYLISPNIMKYQVRVNPGIIIFSLIAGGALFGIWGLLIAVPTVAIIQETLRYYLIERSKTTS
jgi:predicted PurR-regulated permease PerM